jgi:hypothetical protein
MSRATDHDATTSPTAPVRMTYEEFLQRYDGCNAEWVRSVVRPGLWLTTHWLWRRPPLMGVLKAWGLV